MLKYCIRNLYNINGVSSKKQDDRDNAEAQWLWIEIKTNVVPVTTSWVDAPVQWWVVYFIVFKLNASFAFIIQFFFISASARDYRSCNLLAYSHDDDL